MVLVGQCHSPGLAQWCAPRWVVFSGDGRWNVPAINATYESVGAKTLHTFDRGAIQVRIDPAGVRVDPTLGPGRSRLCD
ncbi:MAG: hypothetical protein LLF97_06790 [Planctomycetaceae bacterium]|nr:hypothetical protein [Planctomycetaceae bacterium]